MNPLFAARAYAAVQGTNSPSAITPAASQVTSSQGPGFAELLQGVVTQTAEQTRGAEVQMSQMVRGQGNLIDVVTAISSAETSLETVLSVRDQVISAYQEIMRMPI